MAFKRKILIIGAGHAGIESAHICARLGVDVLLATLDKRAIGRMSCNPAIGGIAKSHVVREIDALGGIMGFCADRTAIQYKLLNRRKGLAVRSTRTQNDRKGYEELARRTIEETENIEVLEGEISSLIIESNKISGAMTADGTRLNCDAVIVATGTFLRGRVFIGKDSYESGRRGELPANHLSDWLSAQGMKLLRFKTGTPPRVDGRTVDYSKTIPQPGENDCKPFSIRTEKIIPIENQALCFSTRTTPRTCAIVRENIVLSAMFDGRISGKGPRYCPSMEVKVSRFPEREMHPIFLEPEGKNSDELYVNGLSMSLPAEIQLAVLRSIPGLENCEMAKPGYAVEYDAIDPRQLDRTLEFDGIEGLFFAGQVNGTSGYEEAGGQGILAGINAVMKIRGEERLILSRDESYIGVMVDDLVRFGVDEPYRLFTARAEHRLKLREDNAIRRMLPHARRLGTLPENILERYERFEELYEDARGRLKTTMLSPDEKTGARSTGETFLRKPKSKFSDLVSAGLADKLPSEVVEWLETDILYEGYIEREDARIRRTDSAMSMKITDGFDFGAVPSLSAEARERIAKRKPLTIRELAEIPGITPADIAAVCFSLKNIRVSHETEQ